VHERAAEFVRRTRDRYGFDPPVEEFPEGTRTAADAARAIGCTEAQIASSLVFHADGAPVVAVTSGANRVSESKLAGHVGVRPESVEMADADAVREATGWAIGGVPPFCHANPLPVYVDESLVRHDRVWAAAGTPEAVFAIAPERLVELAEGTPIDLAE
jgi:prolyl-tRNA editing enzyme YbaK/EbsC (Cys-tRNA(Pro) deacylase)